MVYPVGEDTSLRFECESEREGYTGVVAAKVIEHARPCHSDESPIGVLNPHMFAACRAWIPFDNSTGCCRLGL